MSAETTQSELIALLTDYVAGTLSEAVLRACLETPRLCDALRALVGQTIPLSQGDQMTVGAITNAQGVAIGAGAIAIGDISLQIIPGTTVQGNQTNITGPVTGPVLSGTFAGSVTLQNAQEVFNAPVTIINYGTRPTATPALPYAPFEPATIRIPAGSFRMGCVPNFDCPAYETPQHLVTLPAYRISQNLITHREYGQFIHETGRLVQPEMLWNGQIPPSDLLGKPVSGVSFVDAAAYCAWLSTRTRRSYRLPSEAEWERAATEAQVFGLIWGQLPEWTCTLWGERPRQPDPAFAYPWRDDGRNEMTAGAHVRRVLRGTADSSGRLRATARSSAAPDQIGPPGGRYSFRVVQVLDDAHMAAEPEVSNQ